MEKRAAPRPAPRAPAAAARVPQTPAPISHPAASTGQIVHSQGMTVLVLGILSLVCCGPLGFVAWLTGNSVLQEIDAQPGRYANRTVVQVGRVLGMLGVGIFALAAFFWVVGTFSSS